MIVRCSCGKVECEAAGAPIMSVVCFCDDCQEGSRQIEALPGAPSIHDPDGGTPYVLYRKDRFRCSSGGELLRARRLRDASPTKRVVASCCNSGMYLDFEKGHWLSIYRGRFVGSAAPLKCASRLVSSMTIRVTRKKCRAMPRIPSGFSRNSCSRALQCSGTQPVPPPTTYEIAMQSVGAQAFA
jgi:hypothetical protein